MFAVDPLIRKKEKRYFSIAEKKPIVHLSVTGKRKGKKKDYSLL